MPLGNALFQGVSPRVSPRALPDKGSQAAVGAKLLSGDLDSWRQVLSVKQLSLTAEIKSIFYLADQYWLAWNDEVDVAKGIIPGDTTHRIYLTGLDAPRFTNVALATTGPEPYPVATRLLGVPSPDTAPTTTVTLPTTPDVDVSDAGDQLSSWTYSGPTSTISVKSIVEQDATTGNPAPSYKMTCGFNFPSAPAYLYRDFGVDEKLLVEFSSDVIFQRNAPGQYEAEFAICCDSGGYGSAVKIGFPVGATATPYLMIGIRPSWSSVMSPISQVPLPSALTAGAVYRVTVSAARNTDGTVTITFTLKSGSTVIYTATQKLTSGFGGYCGFCGNTAFSLPYATWYDNIEVKGSGVYNNTTDNTATSYVYTFVNDLGEESAPSPASAVVLRDSDMVTVVTTPTTAPADYGITTKRIYRAVTGTTGSVFEQVDEIPLSQADYEDTKTDSALGIVLPSEDWDTPPTDLRGIIALPNGIMAGFRANQLCLSAQNQPHAWPVNYRLNTDFEIVGIGAIDTTIVIATKGFPYMAAGSTPDAYSMLKIEVPQACVSKRSVAYLLGAGVVFASPDGLISVAGPGSVRNLTAGIFTREQWQALNPSSIIAVAHDDRYFMFYDIDETMKGGFIIDTKDSGFGAIEIPMHASAVHADPVTDTLYLVLDKFSEPDDTLLPVAPTGPASVDGTNIYAWDSDDSKRMTYRWKSKLWQTRHPTGHQFAQVRALDYSNIVFKYYVDGVLVYSKAVTGTREFRIPEVVAETSVEYELIGTSAVNEVVLAEDVEEMG